MRKMSIKQRKFINGIFPRVRLKVSGEIHWSTVAATGHMLEIFFF